MRARVAPKFEDAVASFRRRGFIISEPSPDTDDAAAAAPPDVIWDNAAAIEFPTLPPTTFVNHLVRTSEFGHKGLLCVNVRGLGDRAQSARMPRTWLLSNTGDMIFFISNFAYFSALNVLLGAASGASPPTAVRAAIAYCNKFAEALAYHESRQHCVFLKDSECVTSSLWSTLVRGDVLTDDGSTIVSDGDLIAIQRLLADAGAMWPELCTQGGPVTAPIRNVWIVKPTHLSKGEGIRVFDDAMQAVAYAGELAYDVIAQKYIERPLCVAGKKLDIRQWVLVTDVNPLTIWMFVSSYARFSSAPFTLDVLDDRFIHLCNRSVQEKVGTVGSGSPEEVEVGEESGLMWSSQQLQQQLIREYGGDMWNERVRPAMRSATIAMLQSVSLKLDRKGVGVEWIGIDFLIDDTFGVHLLEANVSPDASHLTPVLAAMVPVATEGAIRLLLDEDGCRCTPESSWPTVVPISPISPFPPSSSIPFPSSFPSLEACAALGLTPDTLAWELVYRDSKVYTDAEVSSRRKAQVQMGKQQARLGANAKFQGALCKSPADVVSVFNKWR